MVKKKIVKKVAEKITGSVKLKYYAPHRSCPKERYLQLKSAIKTVITKLTPGVHRQFNVNDIVRPGGTKGLLREYLKGEFLPVDRYAFYNIIWELVKEDKVLRHKGGRYYTRIK